MDPTANSLQYELTALENFSYIHEPKGVLDPGDGPILNDFFDQGPSRDMFHKFNQQEGFEGENYTHNTPGLNPPLTYAPAPAGIYAASQPSGSDQVQNFDARAWDDWVGPNTTDSHAASQLIAMQNNGQQGFGQDIAAPTAGSWGGVALNMPHSNTMGVNFPGMQTFFGQPHANGAYTQNTSFRGMPTGYSYNDMSINSHPGMGMNMHPNSYAHHQGPQQVQRHSSTSAGHGSRQMSNGSQYGFSQGVKREPQSPSMRFSGSQASAGDTPLFGSDMNFSQGGHYRPPAQVQARDKSGNLLGAYIPAQTGAMRPPQTPATYARSAGYDDAREVQSNHSSPGSFSERPAASPGPGQQAAVWGSLGLAQNDEDRHKRRRSKADPSEDQEYNPGSATAATATKRQRRMKREAPSEEEREEENDISESSNKRRRTSNFRLPSRGAQSNSPAVVAAADDDEDDEEGSQKKSRGKATRQRENLSETQKRFNHIQSEKKRRDIINNGYSELNTLVPLLAQGKSGMSRSESLTEVAIYIEALTSFDDFMRNHLKMGGQMKVRQGSAGGDGSGAGDGGGAYTTAGAQQTFSGEGDY